VLALRSCTRGPVNPGGDAAAAAAARLPAPGRRSAAGPARPAAPAREAIFASAGGSRIWTAEERDAFIRALREPARAEATSRLYRTFLLHELPAVARGTYADERLTVPTRLVVGRSDPVVTAAGLHGYETHADDMAVELIEGGHFLLEEQPEAVSDRVRAMPG